MIDESKYFKIKDLGEEMNKELAKVEEEIEYYKQKALKAYSFGMHKANKNMRASDPIRLSIALNYSVF